MVEQESPKLKALIRYYLGSNPNTLDTGYI